ncbi:unnamed protein product [Parnassius apollo]|uniref:(apollo) hypothetical protein n=1 Tax=Parnassius apollo TaxID=110799 RepID=A0A8S3YD15_PARAO|nr:unnamed protein product [Parnassius apollo]
MDREEIERQCIFAILQESDSDSELSDQDVCDEEDHLSKRSNPSDTEQNIAEADDNDISLSTLLHRSRYANQRISDCRYNGRPQLQTQAVQGDKPSMDRRDQRRAYEYQQHGVENNWTESRPFEERPKRSENGERKMEARLYQRFAARGFNHAGQPASIGNTTTSNVEKIQFNLPDIAVSQEQQGDVPLAHFDQLPPKTITCTSATRVLRQSISNSTEYIIFKEAIL